MFDFFFLNMNHPTSLVKYLCGETTTFKFEERNLRCRKDPTEPVLF
uniref:Uncharacterized protein n=1 Tax=Mus musculus TaxID=10090 RepID=Q3UQ77_MOUSE|nr:unnamed protein product [Mus musculus]